MATFWGIFRIPFRVLLVTMATTLLLMWVRRGGDDVTGGRSGQRSDPELCCRNRSSPKGLTSQLHSRVLPDCSFYTSKLAHQTVRVNLNPVTFLQLKERFAAHLQHGGHYCPADCKPRDHSAILIPYRDRRQQLGILLLNLVPFLIRQRVCFTLFVVEQTWEFPFNRCLLFNVGFVESQKVGHFSCFILHDTDLIPRRYDNLYHCHDNHPRHFVITRSNKPFSGLPYPGYSGGVLAVRRHQMEKINGCSNLYYNWGFEDDDLYERFRLTNQTPVRYPDSSVGDYVAVRHSLQPRNRHKRELLSTVAQRMAQDGLSSLRYTVLHRQQRPLYTWIRVRIPPPPPAVYGPLRTAAPNTRR